jgi:hypothetical protein
MVTNREEQLHRYFEHVMSPAEEQSFLITVAASDEMRIAFRSQLELMKAVRSDKDSLRSVAQVRNRTLTALGLSATAVTPFIEHELLRGAKDQSVMVQSASIAGDVPPLSGGWIGRISSLIRQPIIALTGGLALGVLSTTVVIRQMESNGNVVPVTQTVPQTSINPASAGTGSQINGKVTETIPPGNGLNNSGGSTQSASRRGGQNNRTVAQTSASIRMGASASSTIPELTRSAPAKLRTHKATIIKDSAR